MRNKIDLANFFRRIVYYENFYIFFSVYLKKYNAHTAANICTTIYPANSCSENNVLSRKYIIQETAGLKCPPDILPPMQIDAINARPMANGAIFANEESFFVAIKITVRKVNVPKNSTKYLIILYNIRYFYKIIEIK
jgi:hypothetical protein